MLNRFWATNCMKRLYSCLILLLNSILTSMNYWRPKQKHNNGTIHNWRYKGVHKYPKGISPKVNATASLEFELTIKKLQVSMSPQHHKGSPITIYIYIYIYIYIHTHTHTYISKYIHTYGKIVDFDESDKIRINGKVDKSNTYNGFSHISFFI